VPSRHRRSSAPRAWPESRITSPPASARRRARRVGRVSRSKFRAARRGARIDVLDEPGSPPGRRNAESFPLWERELDGVVTEVTAAHRGQNRADRVDRNAETEPRADAVGENERRDRVHSPRPVEDGAPAVARGDRRVGLDQIRLDVGVGQMPPRMLAADDPDRETVFDAEGVADHEHPIADLEIARPTGLHNRAARHGSILSPFGPKGC